MPAAKRTRTDWLQEALLLEQLRAEWTVAHVAAFCTVSTSFIMRSECPKIEKEGVRGVKGKRMIRFDPAAVRAWNNGRTRRHRQ